MASTMGFRVPPFSAIKSCHRNRFRAQAQKLDGGSSMVSSSDSIIVNGALVAGKREKEKDGSRSLIIEQGNGPFRSGVEQRTSSDTVLDDLAPLWDDGYGTQTVEDYFNAVKEMNKAHGGPPRWFCPVECGRPLKDSPTLLFLPEIRSAHPYLATPGATVHGHYGEILYEGDILVTFVYEKSRSGDITQGLPKVEQVLEVRSIDSISMNLEKRVGGWNERITRILGIPWGFLIGLDGTGMGLILHHKALGKAFEVRCLHIPVQDRTPFEGLVELVEEAVKFEYALSPNKPIYLLGDSFGGCLALAVAARNPKVDLVLILANPATPFGRSQLQPLFPFLEALPDGLHATVPYLLSFVMGDPIKMASVNIENRLPPTKKIEQLSYNLTAMLPCLTELANIVPKDTLLWKLRLLKSAAAYANSRLHAVKAEVLVLASGKDNMLPSGEEAKRLKRSLQNCKVRYFKDSGHTLLLEDGIGLLTIIKGTCLYRRSRRRDLIMDFIPPSMTEFKYGFDQVVGLFRSITGSVMFSTLEDGKIVKGLVGVPDEGPVLLVGYHNLLGIELISIIEKFLSEKNIMVRGIAHPVLFRDREESSSSEFSMSDWVKVFGGVPVAASNLYKLLSTKSHVLLYPGGAREALHFKGEGYKLIWPDQQEFVRMAARFGATIVPFGAVGQDDIFEMLLDYKDLMKIPLVNDFIKDTIRRDSVKIRDEASGEVANQNIFLPVLLPKIPPGRYYYLFGKPIKTQGMESILKDKEKANQLYLQVKSEVEHNISYLIKKREEDPYRSVVDRKIYQAIYSSDTPSFNP